AELALVEQPTQPFARALVGTPPVLSLAALEVGVDIALQAPMDQLRAKSLRQTALFAELVGQECREWEFHLVSPTDPAHRGSQVSLAHPRAYAIMQALIARGVIGDFRAPNILRFGMTPLYLRHAELWDAVQALRAVMQDGEWERPEYQARRAVT
ncbi:MAG: kynureninase, partial [Rhodospirillales bacterium]|nr:kynureninase [Rhodospirillales bacterium]